MNSIMERWVQTCRRELPDRTLIWNQPHLLHTLQEFEQFYNGHRPHQGIANACQLHPLPAALTAPDQNATFTYDDVTDSVECFMSTGMRHELHG
jgi:putative transposase